MYELPQEPHSIAKVLDNGFKLFVSSFKHVLLLSMIGVAAIISPNFLIPGLSSQDPAEIIAAAQSYSLLFLVLWMVFIIFYNAIFFRIGRYAQHDDENIATALGVGAKKLIPVLLAAICYVIAVIVGSILLVIPGIILMLSLFFYVPLIVLDDEGIVSSLKRSHKLVWGDWWRTAAVFMVPFVIYMAFYFLMGVIVGVLAGVSAASGVGESTGMELFQAAQFWMNIMNFVISVFIYPFLASIMIVQLNDLKLRKQGLDLEARIGG